MSNDINKQTLIKGNLIRLGGTGRIFLCSNEQGNFIFKPSEDRVEQKSFKINYNNKLEEQKREKYNSEEIFKNKPNNSMSLKTEESKEKLEMVVYKKQKLYQKTFAEILKIFRRN